MEWPEVASNGVEAVKRALGSKRYASFASWMVYLGLAKPDFRTVMFTGAVLGGLCLLFQQDQGDDADASTVTKVS